MVVQTVKAVKAQESFGARKANFFKSVAVKQMDS